MSKITNRFCIQFMQINETTRIACSLILMDSKCNEDVPRASTKEKSFPQFPETLSAFLSDTFTIIRRTIRSGQSRWNPQLIGFVPKFKLDENYSRAESRFNSRFPMRAMLFRWAALRYVIIRFCEYFSI